MRNDGSGLLRIIISVWRVGGDSNCCGGLRGWISFSSLEELDFSLGPGWTSLGHLNKSTRHARAAPWEVSVKCSFKNIISTPEILWFSFFNLN